MMIDLKKLLELLQAQRLDRRNEKEELVKAVTESIEKHAIQNGHLTQASVTAILNQQSDEQQKKV